MAYEHLRKHGLMEPSEAWARRRREAKEQLEALGLVCEYSSWHTAPEDWNVRLPSVFERRRLDVWAHVHVEQRGKHGSRCYLVEIAWRAVRAGAPNTLVGRFMDFLEAGREAFEALSALAAAARLSEEPLSRLAPEPDAFELVGPPPSPWGR